MLRYVKNGMLLLSVAYTENRWGEAKNYDLCLNATLGREACADLIVAAARAMQEADK